MKQCDYKTKQDELFERWKKARPSYDNFSDDGILVKKYWDESSPKIMFLLKESNDDFFEIRGRGWGPSGNSNNFWRNINIWKYVIAECFANSVPSATNIDSVTEQEVNSIAYVNLKKKSESRSISNDTDIESYVVKDKKFLVEQINLINPDVILCGGTFKWYKLLFSPQKLTEKACYFNKTLVIDFYHPSCRKKQEESFNELNQIMNENEVVSFLKEQKA